MLQRPGPGVGPRPRTGGHPHRRPTGAQLAADPEAARALLAQACRRVRQMGVQAVILVAPGWQAGRCGAALQVSVPVIDSGGGGCHLALRAHPVPPERKVAGLDVAWVGFSRESTALGLAGWFDWAQGKFSITFCNYLMYSHAHA